MYKPVFHNGFFNQQVLRKVLEYGSTQHRCDSMDSGGLLEFRVLALGLGYQVLCLVSKAS